MNTKLSEFKLPIVNRRSNKAFTATIKAKSLPEAEKKAKVKFPFPVYQLEWE